MKSFSHSGLLFLNLKIDKDIRNYENFDFCNNSFNLKETKKLKTTF